MKNLLIVSLFSILLLCASTSNAGEYFDVYSPTTEDILGSTFDVLGHARCDGEGGYVSCSVYTLDGNTETACKNNAQPTDYWKIDCTCPGSGKYRLVCQMHCDGDATSISKPITCR